MYLSRRTIDFLCVCGWGVSEAIEIFHRSHVLQQGLIWVLGTQLKFLAQPPLVVSGELLAEFRSEALHCAHSLSNRSEPSSCLVRQGNGYFAVENFGHRKSHRLLIMF